MVNWLISHYNNGKGTVSRNGHRQENVSVRKEILLQITRQILASSDETTDTYALQIKAWADLKHMHKSMK